MNTMSRRSRLPLTIALAGALAIASPLLLSGCSLIQGTIQNATGGNVNLGGKSVPSDFPTADVPLVNGEIQYGASVKQGSDEVWNLTYKIADGSVFDSIKSQLEGAGFTVQGTLPATTDQGNGGTWTKGQYTVLVVVAKTGSDWTANYTVSKTTSTNNG